MEITWNSDNIIKLTWNYMKRKDKIRWNYSLSITTTCVQRLFSMRTWVSRHQKSNHSGFFSGARDNGMAVASGGPYANHLHLVPDR